MIEERFDAIVVGAGMADPSAVARLAKGSTKVGKAPIAEMASLGDWK